MILVLSGGKTFLQGWNDPIASYTEKPAMPGTFTYDYWLDSTEITQQFYFEVTGRRPVPPSSRYGVGDRHPVCFVSWFDAALFCNARSKADRIDTVYVYSGRKLLTDGSVGDLTGVYADLSKPGYRLPTEAEWEYAARGGSSAPYRFLLDDASAGAQAWYVKNAGGVSHPVATKIPNSLGFYDMEGNVFEWTNDWKAAYDSSAIINPLGAPGPGGECEKVIKGGAFNYDLAFLRPTIRGATYPAIPSSSNEYVGFRCARSVIPNGHFIGSSRSDFTPNPVLLLTQRGALYSLLNAITAKLVFVDVTGDRRTLCAVNFSENFLCARHFTDDGNVFTPALSPNGRYVAYCSRNEGLTGPAKISVRSVDSTSSPRQTIPADSAYVPRWWVDPVTMDTFIIFTNASVSNADAAWRSTKTYGQKMHGAAPDGVPSEIITDGSYHDGLSRSGQFAVTGSTRLFARDLITGGERQIFLPPQNGKDSLGSTQVCNVSISPDTGAGVRCMFLDFGYSRQSSVTGCSYGIHQYIFIATLLDSITKCIPAPTGEKSWDNPQWSNRPEFAVACGRGSTDQAHALYCIDLGNNRCERIVEGVELQQPSLWVGGRIPNPAGLPLDSAGRYDDPLGSVYQAQLAGKLLLFWQRCDSLEIAVIGSSQAVQGMGPLGPRSFNFAAAGVDLLGQKEMIVDYLLPHCRKLKAVCSSLDAGWLGSAGGDFSWNSGLGRSSGFHYDSSHAFWRAGVSADFKAVVRALPTPFDWDTVQLGFFPSSCGTWGGQSPSCANTQAWTIGDSAAAQNLRTIAMLADSVRARGVHWVMIDYPVSPRYKNTPYYSEWGPLRQTAIAIQGKMAELGKVNPFFHFYNANMNGDHDYSADEASDENHLCFAGAIKLAARVDSLLHAIIR